MARKARDSPPLVKMAIDPERIAALSREDPIAGVPGPGRWLVLEYQPTSLFSLKTSQATSSVGVTLIIPTPYAVKMAFVDAAFRAGFDVENDYDEFLRSLATVDVRIAPAPAAVVTNTFVKVRQESRDGDPLRPYGTTIAYREIVALGGSWLWAFDLACADVQLAQRLVRLAPYVSYVGKRGSFIQYRELHRRTNLEGEFTQPLLAAEKWTPERVHIRPLDDFGPEANLEFLSSFTFLKPKRDKHRRFVPTIIPIGVVNAGPGFTEYRRG